MNKKKKPWKKPQLVVHNDLETVAQHCPDRADLTEVVKCSRCRNRHTKGERVAFPMKDIVGYNEVCPRCGCHSYYEA